VAAATARLSERVFLLSPADAGGRRAALLRSPDGASELARRLRSDAGAPLGEVFAFISSLYFRGKLAYASAFSRPPAGAEGAYVITPADGLRTPDVPIRSADLERFAGVPVDPEEPRYRRPLLRDLEALAGRTGSAPVVLLGSIASKKYVELLLGVLGARLHFPTDFVGRGDMSRGGLLLRSAGAGRELPYQPLAGARLNGPRPAKLPPLPR
jgi:hypothetical protein